VSVLPPFPITMIDRPYHSDHSGGTYQENIRLPWYKPPADAGQWLKEGYQAYTPGPIIKRCLDCDVTWGVAHAVAEDPSLCWCCGGWV